MSGMFGLMAAVSCLILLGCVIGMAWVTVAGLRGSNSGRIWSRSDSLAYGIALICIAVLILRPHEHTFQGLDSSAYRLMAKAFLEGRPFKSVDETLMEVPSDVRSWLLLLPSEQGRITRDRSFEIESLDSCVTKPFFYPLLPLCMLGFDLMVPCNALDYMVPFLAVIFCGTCLLVAMYQGGKLGIAVWLALLLGSPLPTWLFRGCYVETVAGILTAMVLLAWICQSGVAVSSNLPFLTLGLAVSFHPVMLVLAIPVAGSLLMDSNITAKKMAINMAAFVAGLAPLIILTLCVASPYGSLSMETLRTSLIYNASIRPAAVASVMIGIAFLVLLCTRNLWINRIAGRGWVQVAIPILLLVLWIAPTGLSMKYWEMNQGNVVRRGLVELWDGLQVPFGTFLILSCIWMLIDRRAWRSKIGVTAVCLSLPIFLYLKGAEHMGIWSQRRLIASLLIVIVCCLPVVVMQVRQFASSGRFRPVKLIASFLLLAFLACTNAARWPAPYIVQYEKGADAWVKTMLDRIGNKLTAVDYHPYSVPLATGGKSRVIGLSEFGFEGLPALSKWLARRAQEEEVLWLTAYANPGLEEGVILEPVGRETIRLDRVRSKTALPAVKYEKTIDVGILRARPVSENDSPVIHKVFDKGPLGLRGPWGRNDITIKLPNGNRLPACWSREGSGIIGPVPPLGGSVRIRVDATAERHDGLNHQTLRFRPPWDGEALSLLISNDFTSVSGELLRPSSQTNDVSRTGTYRIYADAPYSPRKVGITGFSDDLGALIHQIRIELVGVLPKSFSRKSTR